jgi:hypothetical protein
MKMKTSTYEHYGLLPTQDAEQPEMISDVATVFITDGDIFLNPNRQRMDLGWAGLVWAS